MPEFVDPFKGLTPDRKLTRRELTRAIRLALAAEEEAVHLYEAIADATDNELIREVMQDVADEEKVHAGEFQKLLNILLPDETEWLKHGAEEVQEIWERITGKVASEDSSQGESIPTIGKMKKGDE